MNIVVSQIVKKGTPVAETTEYRFNTEGIGQFAELLQRDAELKNGVIDSGFYVFGGDKAEYGFLNRQTLLSSKFYLIPSPDNVDLIYFALTNNEESLQEVGTEISNEVFSVDNGKSCVFLPVPNVQDTSSWGINEISIFEEDTVTKCKVSVFVNGESDVVYAGDFLFYVNSELAMSPELNDYILSCLESALVEMSDVPTNIDHIEIERI